MKRFAPLVLFAVLAPLTVAAQSAKAKTGSPARYTLSPESEARFVVREQLVGATLPNEAIGSTRAITGTIVLDGAGKVDRAASRIVVQLDSLRSDKERRDRFIKRRTLVTDSFPTAVLVPTELRGFPAILPASGALTFTVIGDLTVHGVTRSSTWEASATVAGGVVTGTASTHLRFGDFNMDRPRVAVVLSVVDDIKLEFDFQFVPAGT